MATDPLRDSFAASREGPNHGPDQGPDHKPVMPPIWRSSGFWIMLAVSLTLYALMAWLAWHFL